MFAVILSPFIDGAGGIAFSSGNGNGWEVVTGATPSDIAENHNADFDSFKLSQNGIHINAQNNWVDETIIMNVGAMAMKAEEFLGHRVDIEFVVDKNDKIWILQLRTLREFVTKEQDRDAAKTTEVVINSLDELNTLRVEASNKLNLVIGDEIDLNQFQGSLFRWLIKNREAVKAVTLSKRIPRTGHFANICLQLGIKLNFSDA